MGIDPVSMTLALAVGSAVAGGAGALEGAAGQKEVGQANSEAAAYQAQVATNNAAIAQENATMDIQAGEVAAVNKGLQTRATVGSEKANQGASGIDVNTGSAVDVRAGTAEMGMLDALTIRSDAAKKAYAQEVHATSDTAQSQLDTMQSQQALKAGDIAAEGTMLSGASTVMGNAARFGTQFGPSFGSGSSGSGGGNGSD